LKLSSYSFSRSAAASFITCAAGTPPIRSFSTAWRRISVPLAIDITLACGRAYCSWSWATFRSGYCLKYSTVAGKSIAALLVGRYPVFTTIVELLAGLVRNFISSHAAACRALSVLVIARTEPPTGTACFACFGMNPMPTLNFARLMMLAMLPVEPKAIPALPLRRSFCASPAETLPARAILSLSTMSCQNCAAATAGAAVSFTLKFLSETSPPKA
jgi:hypothetical protein